MEDLLDGTFQSTPLREGRLEQTDAEPDARQFQSTPLREGRLQTLSYVTI
jgi:hypothetical protein